MREKLLKIYEKSGSRNYTKYLKKDKELYDELKSKFGDISLPELFYLGINEHENPICDKGNRKKFKNIHEGYRKFCGSGKQCSCRVEKQSETIKNIWRNRTNNEKEQILDKIKSSNIEKYGVDNPLKNKE